MEKLGLKESERYFVFLKVDDINSDTSESAKK